jgi:protease-4
VGGYRVGTLEIKDSINERPGPLDWLAGAEAPPTMWQLIGLIDDAPDRSLQGLLIQLKDLTLTRSQADELGAAMELIRGQGVRVSVFAENYGPTELLLGSHADEVIIQSGGGVSLPGLYMEEMYLAGTLDFIGLKADLVQVGAYKGANEALTRTAPSPEWDQNISALLDDLYGAMRSTIKEGRGMDDAALDKAMSEAWFASDETARSVGLIDAIVDLPDLSAHLAQEQNLAGAGSIDWVKLTPEGAGPDLAASFNPFAIMNLLSQTPDNTPKRDTIALIHIDGPIVDGESADGGLFGGKNVGSRTIRKALSDLEDNDLIKGVIVRINSPGGSATASEVIWQGVRRVAEKKPVWVSVGSMAASGGYYIAVAGDKIYVTPTGIVGSIGVVGGKISMGGLYDLLHVNVVERARGPRAELMSSSQPWTDEQRQFVRDKMAETYNLFTKRVSAGREGIDLAKTAEGRLFVGQRAVDMKLADTVGGLDRAVADLAAKLNLSEGQYDVLNYPGPKSLQDVLGEMFGQMAMAGEGGGDKANLAALSDKVAALRAVVGETAWPNVQAALEGLVQLRTEPVLLVAPRALIVR